MPSPHPRPARIGHPLAGLGAVALVALAAAACTPSATSSAGDGAIAVESTSTECRLSATTAPAGTVSFRVTNAGDEVTEFYVLADDGLRVISEVENVGPGLARDLVVQLAPGTYRTACKPGMVGDGITAQFTVTESGTAIGGGGTGAEQLAAAEAAYLAYVKDQAGALIAATREFADTYATGDDDRARGLYAPARVHWERIEPVAESFGDLDPILDAREADLAEGDTWTGWHRIEKDLWPPAPEANGGDAYTPLTPAERTAAATQLVATTEKLVTKVNDPSFSFAAFQIGNGAKELLDEVAGGKVTGEEEIWSHTDLWDFQANVDGARIAFEVLRDVVAERDATLATTLETRFAALDALLAEHGSIETGFVGYDTLTDDQVRALAAAVDALGEPLSKLTATVVGAG